MIHNPYNPCDIQVRTSPYPTPTPTKPPSSTAQIPNRYAVVVDAGSSGSRVQVFSWKDPALLQSHLLSSLSFPPTSASSSSFPSSSKLQKTHNKALNSVPQITQDPKYNKKITPGLSSFAGKTNDLWDSHLEPLIKHAESGVPEDERQNTPLFFLATAGMRLLSDDEQSAMLLETCEILREKTDFFIPECESHVSIIDGETEALYGWISLNYLLQTFDSSENTKNEIDQNNQEAVEIGTSSKKFKSFGFMDMGGASMQVAFSPNSTETKQHIDDLYTVRLRSLNGKMQDWRVFVSSWLGFGTNEARQRYSRHLLVEQGYKNYAMAQKIKRSLSSSLLSSKQLPRDPCFPTGISHNLRIDSNTTLTFQGSGNFTSCLHSMEPLLRKNEPCKEYPCLFNGIHAPVIDYKSDKFVGASEYWYTANNIFKLGGHYDFKTFSKHVAAYCGMPWDELRQQTGPGGAFEGIDEEQLQTACFKATWIISVLHSGFELPIDEYGKLMEIEHKPTPSYFKTKNEPVTTNLSKNKWVLKNSTSNINRSDIETFSTSFQSAFTIENTELTWMLGRVLLYASSQVPPAPSSTLQAGHLPANESLDNFILGGELDGTIPSLNFKIKNKPTDSYPQKLNTLPIDSLTRFLASIFIFVLVGHTLLYILRTFKHKRYLSWPLTKLRFRSISIIPTCISKRLLGKAHFKDSSTSSDDYRYDTKLSWNSGNYQRVLEEGGVGVGGGLGSGIFASPLSQASGSESSPPPTITFTSPTLSDSGPGVFLDGPFYMSPSQPSLAHSLRGSLSFVKSDNSSLFPAFTAPVNRATVEKSNSQEFLSGTKETLRNENGNNGLLISCMPDTEHSNHIDTSRAYTQTQAGFGKSTSTLNFSVGQSQGLRPPSRPSSRLNLLNSNNGFRSAHASGGSFYPSRYGSNNNMFGMREEQPDSD